MPKLPGRGHLDHHIEAGVGHVRPFLVSRPTWSTTRENPYFAGGGYLTIDRPWPATLRGTYGNHERHLEAYWSRFEGRYFAGDGAKVDEGGYIWLLGRVDDVMNVSGHRISTIEVESALVDHPSVAEAAVVGAADPTTGQAIIVFRTLKSGVPADPAHGEMLRNFVADKIGQVWSAAHHYLH